VQQHCDGGHWLSLVDHIAIFSESFSFLFLFKAQCEAFFGDRPSPTVRRRAQTWLGDSDMTVRVQKTVFFVGQTTFFLVADSHALPISTGTYSQVSFGTGLCGIDETIETFNAAIKELP
jgi:hypothetical protein